MLTLSHNGNPVIYYNIQRQNTQKILNNVLNQNVKAVKKRARLATLAMSIVDNFCLYVWNRIKIRLPRLIINTPCGSNFMTIVDFFISH